PTNDLYGGHRPGDNLFAESLVCLDAKTGERVWHFQFVHHGVWDYDTPTAPTLLDITVGGRRIKAVAQVTKQAFTYVFDRVTGEPVWPIEERPVPQSNVPGEQTAPTQPFPTRPAPFDRQGVSGDDLLDFTAELNAEARRIASEYRMGPLYTPPILAGDGGLRALLMLPHMTGGANWQGGAVDPETGVLYVASVTNPTVAGLASNPTVSTMDYVMGRGQRRRGPAALEQPQGCGEIGPLGLPLIKPPWGRITAIDLNTGDHLWMVPNGDTPDCVKDHPALSGVEIPRTGKPERSGILVTRTLMFAGEGAGVFATPTWAGGPMFYAYDKQTGDIVWEFELPKNQSGIPMTYMVDGRQYLAMAISARGEPAELVALALPR
ncbi:MAG: PQQ-binding-like beta-propeller repeat protein, partial [Acidobacteria bacterium]|nr:PQQ-binding-like beta-propeller repeat protein [Acidobacteriota bacterium]